MRKIKKNPHKAVVVVPKKRGALSEQERSLILGREDVVQHEEFKDFDGGDEPLENKSDNPFLELRALITGKDIDTKTVLTNEQIVHMHKLDMLEEFFNDEEEASLILERFKNSYMKYVINKDGISRKQFIEALQRGAEKAEQAQASKVLKGLLPAV